MTQYPNPPEGTVLGGNGATAHFKGALAAGFSSIAYGAYALAIGHIARAKGMYSVVMGYRAKDGAINGNSDVVIGNAAETQSPDGEAVALGDHALATARRGIAIGFKALAGALSSTAVGALARADHVHSSAFGRGAKTFCIGSISLGMNGDGVFYLHVNNSHTSRYTEGDEVVERDPLLCETVLEVGMSGYDSTDTPIPDRPGGDATLVGGISTGTAQGGAVRLQVTPPAAESGTAKNARVDALVAHPSRDVEVFSGVIVASPDGSRFRMTVDNCGAWQKELLSSPPPEP